MKKLIFIPALLALVLWIGCKPAALEAQDLTCNSGDIAWVSSAVNADVGLGSGSGRCNTNTVAGAAYNDSAMPWGIQGAFDCACVGLEVRLLGNTGDYGSATNSWNNRFDATKEVRVSVAGNITNYSGIVGYADTSTSCRDSNSSAGCPIEMDFSGGTANGWNLTVGGWAMLGVRIENATTNGILTITANQFGGLEIVDSGGWGYQGLTTGSAHSYLARSLISGSGGSVANTGGALLNTGHTLVQSTVLGVTGDGVLAGSFTTIHRTLIQNASGNCLVVASGNIKVTQNTLRGCDGDGVDIPSSPSTAILGVTLIFNLIAENGGWGINSARHSTKSAGLFMYNVIGPNTSGAVNTTLMPDDSWTTVIGNILGGAIAFASPTDSAVTDSSATIELVYPRGLTPLIVEAGVDADGAGGGGSGGVYRSVGTR